MILRALLALALTTQAAGQEILIKPRLAAGDAFKLEVTKSREDAGKPDDNYTTHTPVTVRVLSASKDGFVIEWRPGAARIEGPGAKVDPAFAMALLQVTMQLLEQAAGKPAPEEVAKARMDLSEKGTVTFDRKVGLISEVTHTRAIAFGPSKRTERWVIRLVTPPRR